MDPGSSSWNAMMVDNSIEVYHLFQRNWLELMAVGAGHSELGSAIQIGEAGDIGVKWLSFVLFHSTPFGISNGEKQLIEQQCIAILDASLGQSKCTQFVRVKETFCSLGNILACVTCFQNKFLEDSQPS
jgi:hypothetical protein